MRRLARVFSLLLPFCACTRAPAGPLNARAITPATAPAGTSSFAARAPAKTRLLASVRIAAFLPGMAAEPLEPLFSSCRFSLPRDVERIELALAEPAEVRLDLTGSVSLESVRCVLTALKQMTGDDNGLEAQPLPHGVRVATRGALADGTGAPAPLARRFEELLLHSESAAVADLAPGGSYELSTDAEGTMMLRIALRSPVQAARAAAWLKSAVLAEPTGGLRQLDVTAEGAVLSVRMPTPSAQQALLLRQGVVEAFRIPSGSMLPTLVPGDHFYAIKGPAVRSPSRGDIVVFSSPRDPSQDFVKRVIGLAGDRIELRGYEVRVNGTPLVTELETAHYVDSGVGPDPLHGELWRESLGEHRYRVVRDEAHRSSDEFDVRVEPDHVFVLGDNRDNSFDSRHFGTVPIGLLKGQVALIWASFGEDGVRWDRFGGEPD